MTNITINDTKVKLDQLKYVECFCYKDTYYIRTDSCFKNGNDERFCRCINLSTKLTENLSMETLVRVVNMDIIIND